MALKDNLLHWWELDDDGTWADSHGSWDLTENGTITVESGTAPDGNDWADFDYSSTSYLDRTNVAWDGGVNTSIAMWVEFDGLSDSTGHWLYSHRGTSSGTDIYHQLLVVKSGSDYLIRFQARDGLGTSATIDSAAVTTGTTYHIVGVSNRVSNHKLYVNTTEYSIATTLNGTVDSASAPFALGQTSWAKTASRRLDGNMGLVGVWDKVLSSSEVSELYNSGNAVRYADLDAPPATNNIPKFREELCL